MRERANPDSVGSITHEHRLLGTTASRGALEDWPPVARMWSGDSHGLNALTCDVEDYFQVSAFDAVVAKRDWDRIQCRIPRNVDRTLECLGETGIQCTFFVLGWVAEKFPSVVRQLASAGHEIASHGMNHTRVWQQTPEQFRNDVTGAKHLLEDVSGHSVRGYRAASWSLDGRSPWAHAVLGEAGYAYSSSVYPIAHDHYGTPRAPTKPFFVRSADILEVPATTVRLTGRNWPAAGGGYFRLFPLPLSVWLLKRANAKRGGAIFYFHPWELDPEQPRIEGISRRARLRHYLNLDKFESRLKTLLREFRWGRMDEVFLPVR